MKKCFKCNKSGHYASQYNNIGIKANLQFMIL